MPCPHGCLQHWSNPVAGVCPTVNRSGASDACPAGVNILRGDGIGPEQDEFALLLDEPRLALNVNTREDLARTEAFLTANALHADTRKHPGTILPFYVTIV